MPRRFLKPCFSGARFCAHCVLTLLRWTLWLGLVVLLILQLRLLAQRELTVPDFILRRAERQLAASGLRIEIGRSTFDPAGRLLLENVRLVSSRFDDPLVTARKLHLQFDPWALAVRYLDVSEVRLEGATCYLPAMLSPSGRAEPLVRDAVATLRPRAPNNTFEVLQLETRVGNLLVTATGAIHRPSPAPGEAPTFTVERLLRDYLRIGRLAAEKLPLLDSLENPRLLLRFTPDETRNARVQAELLADRLEGTLPGGVPLEVQSPRASAAFPLVGTAGEALEADAAADVVSFGPAGVLHAASVRLEAVASPSLREFKLRQVDIAAADLIRSDISAGALRLKLAADGLPSVRAEASIQLGGVPWTLSAEGDVHRRAGTVRAEGVIPHSLLEAVGRLAGRDLGTLLAYETPAAFRAEVTFAEGGRPASARGRLDSGPVNVRGVPLDATGSDFSWEGNRIICNNLLLRQGESEARGSYAMDTATLDYRFLLTGRLRPLGIEGWFRDWWTRFWGNFDFSAAPPQADVDIAGRWRAPHLSTVFVFADALQPGLRGVAFDQVRTRIFVRPEFYDDLEFLATQGSRSARGRFTRTIDLTAGDWRSMEFAVKSDLELAGAGRLFGQAGTEFLEPFRFATPPKLEVSGRLDGPASPKGEHLDVRITADSTGAFAFHRFPLHDLRFTAHARDDELLIEQLAVRFAGGEARGRVELRGRGDKREIGFDAVLSDARLGEAIQSVERFSALRRGETERPESKLQHRLVRGRLDLAVSAEGLYIDPYSYKGTGNAQITGADLAEINLLGILSSMLRRTLLDFTTLQLDTARANFAVEGHKLAFSEFKLTGPRAAIDARGDYYLDSKTVAFNAKVFPFEESSGLLGSAVGIVLTPLSNALEVKLSGELENPSWTFVYGPVNLLRTIIGPTSAKEPAPLIPAPAPASRPDAQIPAPAPHNP